MKENSYNNNMSDLDEEKVNYQEISTLSILFIGLGLFASVFSLFGWCLDVFTFSDSCLSGFCFHHDKR